jgi:hypothetical protein
VKTARDRSGAAALVGASVTGLIAFALFLAGGLLLWANGHYKDADGYLSTGSQRFNSREYAITTPNLQVSAGAPGFVIKADRYGQIRLQTMAKGGKPLFVGVARTADVERWLRGTSFSEVSDIDYAPFKATYAEHHGTRKPGPPAKQRFWAASGAHSLRWNVQSGDWSVVVMNADASAGVDAGVSAGARLPWLDEAGWIALGGGALIALFAGSLILVGVRSPRDAHRPAGVAPAPAA